MDFILFYLKEKKFIVFVQNSGNIILQFPVIMSGRLMNDASNNTQSTETKMSPASLLC